MISSSKYRVLGLIWLMMLVAYMDRVNISVAGKTIMADLHLSKTEFGFILSAFTLGYALLQVPGGWLADRFGSRPLLVAAVLVWSLFTGLTGLASSFGVLILIRVLFGVGEGIENGAQFKLIGDHFESRERSWANGLFLSSLPLGPLIATPFAVWLLGREGWRVMFWCFGGAGMILALLLFLGLPRNDGAPSGALSWQSLGPALKRKGTKPAMLAYLLFNIAYWGFIGWIPTYLLEQRHITLSQLGLMGALPYASGFVGLLVIGWLGSARKQDSFIVKDRPGLVGACYFLAAVAFVVALYAKRETSCVAALSFVAFFLFGSFGPYWTIALDIVAPEGRGAFSGLVNFGGQIGGFIGQIGVGILADRAKNFSGAIWFMAAALLLAQTLMFSKQLKRNGISPQP